MAYSWQTRRRTASLKVTTVLRLLYIVGIIFAIVGIVAALHLFNIRTYEDFYSAQRGRTVSNKVSSTACTQLCISRVYSFLAASVSLRF